MAAAMRGLAGATVTPARLLDLDTSRRPANEDRPTLIQFEVNGRMRPNADTRAPHLEPEKNGWRIAIEHKRHLITKITPRNNMNESQISKVAEILSEWNPLGNKAHNFPDLDGYRTKAIDIIASFHLPFGGATKGARVMTVLNQAFDLSLNEKDCAEPARKIALILERHRK
jgi:hypothetical protein